MGLHIMVDSGDLPTRCLVFREEEIKCLVRICNTMFINCATL